MYEYLRNLSADDPIIKKEPLMVTKEKLVPLRQLNGRKIEPGAVFIMDNHGHARKVWELARFQGMIDGGATLLHIDEHEDIGFDYYHCNIPESIEHILALRDSCGSFILPCMVNGLIRKNYFICPKTRLQLREGEEEILWRGFTCDIPELEGARTPYKDPYEIAIRNTLPIKPPEPVFLDLDLDYFNHHFYGSHFPYFLTERRINSFMQKLKLIPPAVITTIAISTGWTIMERRTDFLQATLQALI